MTPQAFLKQFETFLEAPNGIAKLRELILELAVQGKLGTQDENDEPGSVLRSKILAKRKALIENGDISGFATEADWPDGALPYSLPDRWEWIRLGELGGFLGGGTPSKERAEFWDGSIPWVSPKDMKRPYISDAIDHVSSLGVQNSSGKMIPKGSLLMVVRGMILAHSFPVAVAMRDLTINQDMKALRLALPDLGEYLLRCCTACKSRMLESVERSSHGTCRLPTESVGNFPIPLPPLAEQRRIVEKVDQLLGLCDELAARQAAQREQRQRLVGATLDRLVSTRNPAEFPTHAHRLRNHFDQFFDTPTTIPQLRQTILQLAVQGQLVPQDANDEPAGNDYGTANFRSTHDKSCVFSTAVAAMCVPHSWTITPLNSVCTAIVDCPHSTPKWTDAGKICVRTNQFRAGWLDLSQPQFVNESTYTDRIKRLKPRPDDILYSREGGILGIACRVPAGVELCLGQRMMLFRAASIILAEFLEMVLNSPLITEIAKGRTTGGAAPRVNVATVKAYPIPLPPIAEQKRIVAKVTTLLSLCDTLEAKLTQAESASSQLLSAAVHRLLHRSLR